MVTRIIYNNVIPFSGNKSVAIWPFIFARKSAYPLDDETRNHERIHLMQQLEVTVCSLLAMAAAVLVLHLPLWWLLLSLCTFYVWYAVEFLVRLAACRDGHEAYRNVAFEQEAYLNEGDLAYLRSGRRAFAWTKYLTRKTYRRK